tara:strand:- start:2574 stop:2879 length:306 start_codon:yes stop_codon:yes gene_type:complete
MLIHSVYFWLDESLSSAQKAEFEAGMKALFSIDVVASGEIGTPAATPERPVTNNTFDYALFLKFEKVEDHNAYQIHPDHQVFVDNFSQWFKTVQIYDTEYA